MSGLRKKYGSIAILNAKSAEISTKYHCKKQVSVSKLMSKLEKVSNALWVTVFYQNHSTYNFYACDLYKD